MSELGHCTGCEKAKARSQEQWWNTTAGYGYKGFWCPDCYEIISLDAYAKPKHPEARNLLLAQLKLQQAKA